MKMVKALLMSLAAMMSVVHVAMAANYTVGGADGWDQLTDLATWASSQSFVVGDFLLFQYSPNHDVTEVTAANFGPCTDTNPISQLRGGATVISLETAGSRYFVCTSHCLAGMKVQIDTLAASAPPPATPSPPPPRTPTASPPPPTKSSPSPKTSPPPPSKKNGTTLPPATAPPPSGTLSPPPAPSSAAKFGVKSAIAGFAMMMILLSL